ncbi:hypothetical protein A0U91_01185 [Acetobacter persici]|uniref:Uncharacterized protein n=1 Tax=Acetobacter persici TaxID=1076596 RepID=A0A1U9LC23_9PROT|nr:hypothetical protein A0U91_01185 [Acetobacter persici]
MGFTLEAYWCAQNMSKPLREGRRCWVLDCAQFHMDMRLEQLMAFSISDDHVRQEQVWEI